jgi:hypothetical protein
MIRTLLLASALGLSLGGCADILPEQGFLTHAFDADEDADVSANGCTAQGCPQAPQFCVARGYTPGTDGYQRCLVSVEQNLRKQNR